MAAACEQRVAVVCDDRAELRGPVLRLLSAVGFDVVAVVDAFAEVPALVRDHGACLAVVALPLTGLSGLRAVRALRAAAPGCEVVLLSPSSGLEPAALEAGARALVPEDDLRALRHVLRELAAEPVAVRLPRARTQSDDVAARGSVSTNPSA